MPYDAFWHISPAKLQSFRDAYNEQRRLKDEDMHRMGIYVMRAVGVAVEHCLAGNKARSEYFRKPLLADIKLRQEEKELTEEDKLEAQKALLMQLQIMESNFNTSKS